MKSPAYIFFMVILSVFIAEIWVMLLLYLMPEQSTWVMAIIDGILLTLFVSPILYFLLFQPMLAQARKRQQIEEALLKSKEEQLKIMIHTSLDGFLITDKRGRLLEVNNAYCQMVGYSREELLNMHITDLEAMETPEDTTRHIRSMIETSGDRFETRHHCKNGLLVDLEVSINYNNFEGGRFYSFLRDITERKQTEKQMHHLAHHDILTGLPNRAMFTDRIHQAIAAAKRGNTHLAVIFLDLDKFKPVNDDFGHDVGDLLLKEVAKRLQNCIRESDTVSRTGGDEFLILLPVIETEQNAMNVAEKILQANLQPFELAGHSIHISSSIGVALYPEHGIDETTLAKNADIAMYHAKNSGRSNVKLYRPEMGAEQSARL